jgi:NodT family efflux transporter outer membrane factor (OMF) lipoprotein
MMPFTMSRKPVTPSITPLVLALALALGGCSAVGPDYHGAPQVTHATDFKRTPDKGVDTAPTVADWWTTLNDPQLNDLVQAALQNSPDLRAAQARLRESRSNLLATQRNALPKSSGTAAFLHSRMPTGFLGSGSSSDSGSSDGSGSGSSSGTGGTAPINLYNVNFDATWEVDLFGGVRRSIEAASAEADAVEADLADAHVSLAAEVVQTYIDLRDQQQRLALAQKSAELEQQMLDLTQQRRSRGVSSGLDVERLTTQVETTRSTIIPLDAQITESLDTLAMLTGREPGALDADLATPRPLPTLPASVSIGDPAALLAQRPDIRAAERRLASQNAQIGVHKADLFPKLTLLGDLGFSASDPGHLIRTSNLSYIGVPLLQWNALDFGRTRAQIHQAEAGRDEAQAKYESAVLSALRDANTALSRYGHQRQNAAALQQIEQSADRSATLSQQRYKAGTSSLLDTLDIERTRFAAEQNSVAGQAQLIKYFASLQKSLGMGWQTAPDADTLAKAD